MLELLYLVRVGRAVVRLQKLRRTGKLIKVQVAWLRCMPTAHDALPCPRRRATSSLSSAERCQGSRILPLVLHASEAWTKEVHITCSPDLQEKPQHHRLLHIHSRSSFTPSSHLSIGGLETFMSHDV